MTTDEAWRVLRAEAKRLGVERDFARVALDRLKRSEAQRQAFHWGDAPSGATVHELATPSVLWELGELVEVTYRASKAGRTYDWSHDFRRRLPRLAYASGRLYILGGDYRVTGRGIVG